MMLFVVSWTRRYRVGDYCNLSVGSVSMTDESSQL